MDAGIIVILDRTSINWRTNNNSKYIYY